LSTAEGQVIGGCFERPRYLEFFNFLRRINRQTSRETLLHMVVEDSATLQHEKVKSWLANHRRFRVQITPAGTSWLAHARQVFAEISQAGLRAHSYWSAASLADDVKRYILASKNTCAPFVWTSRTMLLKTYCGNCGVFAD
jgi:hypothetical protein